MSNPSGAMPVDPFLMGQPAPPPQHELVVEDAGGAPGSVPPPAFQPPVPPQTTGQQWQQPSQAAPVAPYYDPSGAGIAPESYGERVLARMEQIDEQYVPRIDAPTYDAPGGPGQPSMPQQPTGPIQQPTGQPDPSQLPGYTPPPSQPPATQVPPQGAPTTTPAGGQAGGGGVGDDPTPPAPSISIDQTLEHVFGRPLSVDEKRGFAEAMIDLSSLNPTQWEMLNKIMAGEGVGTAGPPTDPATPPTIPPVGQPQPYPTNPTPPIQVQPSGDPFYDESIAPHLQQTIAQSIAPVATQLEEMRRMVEEDRQARIAIQNQQINAGLEQGIQAFREAHPDLTEQDITNVMGVVRRDAWFPKMIQQGRQPADAAQASMEYVLSMDTQYQQQRAAQAMQAEQQRIAQEQYRKQVGSQINPAGASVVPQPVDDATGLVQDIEAMLAGGQPSMN